MNEKSKFLTLAAALWLVAAVSLPAMGEAAPEGVFMGLLRFIPDTPAARTEVQLNDYAAAARALGLDRPGPEADYVAVMDYARGLRVKGRMLPSPYISGGDDYAPVTLKTLRARAGYDLRDITASIVAGQPPGWYSAILLDVPTEEVRDRLQRVQDWPPPGAQEYRGVPILTWGDSFEVNLDRRLNPPAYDELGRGANLGFAEGAIFSTLWTDGVRGMISASQGEGPSLADAEEYVLLAGGLEKLGVYSAWLSDRTQSVDSLGDERHCQVLLRPYVAFATGIGRDEGGFFMGWVRVHPTAEAAGENLPRLRERLATCWSVYAQRPWREYFDLERLSLEREGRTLLAKAYFKSDRTHPVWIEWVLYRDPLLAHE